MHAIYNAENDELVGFVDDALAQLFRGHHRSLRDDVLTDDAAVYLSREPIPDEWRFRALRYEALVGGFDRATR